MGKKSGGDQHPVVGYGYNLSFVYGFCQRADGCNGYKVFGNVAWSGSITSSGNYIYATTGRKAKPMGSSYDSNGYIYVYLQKRNGYDPEPTIFPSGLKYSGCVTAYFKNVFVGDNVTAVPKYEFRFFRQYGVAEGWALNQVIRTGVNPAAIIHDILHDQLGIPTSKIDWDSFNKASETLKNEGLAMSFILTRNKKALKWIEEILRYIDGVMYFDFATQKYVLKLFRKDYDINTIPVITKDHVSSFTLEETSPAATVSRFIFNYSDAFNGTQESYIIDNGAFQVANGIATTKTFDFTLVSDFNSLRYMIGRTIQKNTIPISKAKFRLNYLTAASLSPGDVIRLEDPLTSVQTIHRVLKLGGDSLQNPYIDVETMLDIYSTNYEYTPPDVAPVKPPPPDFSLEKSDYISVKPMPVEFSITDDLTDRGFFPVGAAQDAGEFLTGVRIIKAEGSYLAQLNQAPAWESARIIKASKSGFNGLSDVGYNREFTVVLDNSAGRITKAFDLTEEEFQSGRVLATTSRDSKFFYHVKKVELVNDEAIVTGFADPILNDTDPIYIGDTDTLYDVDNGSQMYLTENPLIDFAKAVYYQEYSGYCSDSSNPKYEIDVSVVNDLTEAPPKTVELDDCFSNYKPPIPENAFIEKVVVDNGDGTVTNQYYVKVRPNFMIYGASMQNADTWTGASDEGKVYGKYAIEEYNSSGVLLGVYAVIDDDLANADGYLVQRLRDNETSSLWAIVHWAADLGGSVADDTYIDYATGRKFLTLPE